MKRILFIALISIGFCTAVFARRSPPPEPTPVTYQGIKYTAPFFHDTWTQVGGYVVATDIKSGKQLWELAVYTLNYDKELEGDVQHIFITSLKIVNGQLVVTNEKQASYVIDIQKHTVIKGEPRFYGLAGKGDEETKNILDIGLPTTMSALIQKFGKQAKVDIFSEEEGQWFRWNLKNNGGAFSALGDEYSQKLNTGAVVRYIELKMKPGDPTIPAIHGFTLGKSSQADVKARFPDQLENCVGNLRDKHALKLAQDEFFTYFFFGPDKRLIGVAQATFDLDVAG